MQPQHIADYPALTSYVLRMLAVPGIRETVCADHIKRGYYSIKALKPNGSVPLGPRCDDSGVCNRAVAAAC